MPLRLEIVLWSAQNGTYRDLGSRPEFERLDANLERIEETLEIARALGEARARAGLTTAELAERIETTPAAVARFERGTVRPSGKTLEKVARATGTRLRVAFEPA